MNGILDAAMQIAEEQEALLTQMRSALQSGDQSKALALAKQLCGLDCEQKESNRIN